MDGKREEERGKRERELIDAADGSDVSGCSQTLRVYAKNEG